MYGLNHSTVSKSDASSHPCSWVKGINNKGSVWLFMEVAKSLSLKWHWRMACNSLITAYFWLVLQSCQSSLLPLLLSGPNNPCQSEHVKWFSLSLPLKTPSLSKKLYKGFHSMQSSLPISFFKVTYPVLGFNASISSLPNTEDQCIPFCSWSPPQLMSRLCSHRFYSLNKTAKLLTSFRSNPFLIISAGCYS